MLERRLGRRPGASVPAADENDVRFALGHAGGDGADADFGNELHADARVRVRVLQVVDQLGEVLDRIDVVVRRRRNKLNVRRGVPRLRDPRVHLFGRQLAALAGLRALRHLDLQFLRVDQVRARHAEAAGGDLLDRADAPVAGRVRLEALRVLAALAAVALAADAVHRDRERFVRFLADRAVRHGAGLEALHDLGPRLDFLERDRLAVAGLELQEPAQRGQLVLLAVDQLGVFVVELLVLLASRLLQLGDRQRIEQVHLAVPAPLVIAADLQVQVAGDADGRERPRVPLLHFR